MLPKRSYGQLHDLETPIAYSGMSNRVCVRRRAVWRVVAALNKLSTWCGILSIHSSILSMSIVDDETISFTLTRT